MRWNRERMSDERLAMRIYEAGEDGARGRGRSFTRWVDGVREVFNEKHRTIQQHALRCKKWWINWKMYVSNWRATRRDPIDRLLSWPLLVLLQIDIPPIFYFHLVEICASRICSSRFCLYLIENSQNISNDIYFTR